MQQYDANHILADDGILRHDGKVSTGDDVPVTGGSNEDVRAMRGILHSGDLITSHGGLERIDGINLSDQHTSAVGLQRFSTLSDRKTVRL